MAENDIYDSKGKYDRLKANLKQFLIPPGENDRKRKYYCNNEENLVYFRHLFNKFEAKDLSYVRRNRLLESRRMVCHVAEKNLKGLDREDIDKLVTYMHSAYKTPKSKSDFIRDIKHMWKILFPEKDEKGRIEDSLVPYPVRHLSPKTEKSREKRRNDKVTSSPP